MPLPDALREFVDAELARMPALIEQVRRQTVDALRHPAAAVSPVERMLRFDLAQALEQQAQRFGDAFVEALRHRVLDEPPAAAAPALSLEPLQPLALIDESVHGNDIEIARATALIAGTAEWELRELQTFTSALSGLPYVAVDTNPLRPEAFALALWAAADALPQARNSPLLLRSAAAALADALRLAFAAACTRLEAQGVHPSLYRTAVPTPEERASMLAELLDAVPAPPAGASPATAELLAKLFAEVLRSAGLQPALRALAGLVQTLALDLVAREPGLLDNAGHPLWQLLDRFAHQSATHPSATDPQLLAWVGLAAELLAGIQTTPLHDAETWRGCIEQLDAYAAAQFNTQLQQAQGDIASLRQIDAGQAGLDVASLDTVPAELLDSGAPAEADIIAAAWLDAQAEGSWYRIFLRGRWSVMRLLWRSDAGGVWLFAGPHPQRNDAFNRDTLLRLRAEKLVRPLIQRSVVVRAAETLRRKLGDAGPQD